MLLLQRPVLGLLVIITAALIVRINIGTGTEVNLNPVSLFIPAMLAIWLMDMARKRDLRLVRSRTNLPLLLLLVAGVASLIIGNATWDPFVPRTGNLLLVQLAQLSIIVISAGAYLLAGNLVQDEKWLQYLVWTFLAIAGVMAVIYVWPAGRGSVERYATAAHNRAPLWMLLTAVAGGQLLFNRSLVLWKQLVLIIVLASVGYYSFVLQREVISVWTGVTAAIAMLLWLRFPRFRWLVFLLVIILLITGLLFPTLYEFAGGDAEWRLSGISRIDLSRRVIDVTMRNPITGLGPASYRIYASIEPLIWKGGARIWEGAGVSSHNNYVDMFSHFGLVGLSIFLWFMAEVAMLGLRLRKRFRSGFSSGYINGALATWAGAMVLMVFADWILPFVYNIGFPGFQASVLVWLFLGDWLHWNR